jgi:hypothetical protein
MGTFLDKIKPRSAAMRTTILVLFTVFLAYLCPCGSFGELYIYQNYNNMRVISH